MEYLSQKIKNNESLLNEKNKLKEIQIYCINKFRLGISVAQYYNMNINYYYQIINFFRDIDFCLKLLVLLTFSGFNNIKINFVDEIVFALSFYETRYNIFEGYINQNKKIEKFNEEEQEIITNSLEIKEFIVIGNNTFHEEIKKIEKI